MSQNENEPVIKSPWQVIGGDTGPQMWESVAEDLTAECATQAVLDALGEEVVQPDRTAIIWVALLLEQHPEVEQSMVLPGPVSADDLREWASGRQPIPHNVARVLLHRCLADALNEPDGD